MRVREHPILGPDLQTEWVRITVDGRPILAKKGEVIAAALMANGIRIHRYTAKVGEPRGLFCGIGQCTDCMMVVNGQANVRTCITPVAEGMVIETQYGTGKGGKEGA